MSVNAKRQEDAAVLRNRTKAAHDLAGLARDCGEMARKLDEREFVPCIEAITLQWKLADVASRIAMLETLHLIKEWRETDPETMGARRLECRHGALAVAGGPAACAEETVMRAITVRDRDAGTGGLSLTDMPYPHAAENDVIVRVHAAGFTPGELEWPSTWTDRAGRDRTPSVHGHDLSGVVAKGYGTAGLTVGQRVFGVADWTRNGSLAGYTAVEARNFAPLPAGIDNTVAAALPVSGLTAWQGLFDHGRLTTGQTVLIHGAAGGVGSIAVQFARDVGARIIGTGRAADRDTARGLGVHAFLDLEADHLEDAGEVDVVFDVIGGDILDRSATLVRADGTLVTIAAPPKVRPEDGRAIFFVIEPDRARLAHLAQRLRHGRLKPIIGAIRTLRKLPPRSPPTGTPRGKTIMQVTEG